MGIYLSLGRGAARARFELIHAVSKDNTPSCAQMVASSAKACTSIHIFNSSEIKDVRMLSQITKLEAEDEGL